MGRQALKPLVLMLLGKRDILHGGVLAAVTGQDASSLAGLLMDLFSVEYRLALPGD